MYLQLSLQNRQSCTSTNGSSFFNFIFLFLNKIVTKTQNHIIDSSHISFYEKVWFGYPMHFSLGSFQVKNYVVCEPHLWKIV